jgi:thioredoxin 2
MKNDLHLVCPHCQSINRVPTAKLSEHPNCGRCQQPLFTGEPIELTTATFSRHVGAAICRCWSISGRHGAGRADDGATVPASGAPARTEDRLAKVNTEAEPHLAAQFGIRSIPTLALFQGGREIARQAGAMGAQDIVRWTSTQVGR